MRTLLLASFLLSACTAATPPRSVPLDTDGPVDCKAEQFKSKEQCFDHAADACASLGCGTDCDIHRARASKWVTCDPKHRGYSSHLTQCGGYSGWLCPEGTVCRDDPACKGAFDCPGVCGPP